MFGFLIAVAMGAVTPMLEGPLARPVAKSLSERIDLTEGELRAIAFMIAMIIAGVLCALFSSGSALGLAVGGALGYFGARLVKLLQGIMAGKRD